MKLSKKQKDGLYTGGIETVGDALEVIKNIKKKTKKDFKK